MKPNLLLNSAVLACALLPVHALGPVDGDVIALEARLTKLENSVKEDLADIRYEAKQTDACLEDIVEKHNRLAKAFFALVEALMPEDDKK
jgi:hypothetical protein